MSDFTKLVLLWLGIPIIGALVSYILSCLLTQNKYKGVQNMIRGFEEVKEKFKKTEGSPTLPTRATKMSMAYDFYANKDYKVKPSEVCKIWTDVKAYMQEDEGLILNVRSSMGGRFMLANSQGWIDRDYFGNESNDGNIGIFLLNISDEVQEIRKGDRVAQGMFIKYLVADNGNLDNERTGGFGSTNGADINMI